jgi:hypothetical protein
MNNAINTSGMHPQGTQGYIPDKDEDGLSLGMFMHAKFMHQLCSLLMHIIIYLDVMRCYNHVLH